MRSVLFWLLFPLVLPQALYVRSTAPRFSAAKGATVGAVGTGEPLRLLAIGDSIIAGVGARTLANALVGQTATALASLTQRRVSWQALGVSGYDSNKVLRHLVPKMPEQAFDCILLSVGVNDVTGLSTIAAWRTNLMRILERLGQHSPNATIAVIGLPPMDRFPLLPQPLRWLLGVRARSLDAVISEFAEMRDSAKHVVLNIEPQSDQFAADGYHPSEESYVEFGQRTAAAFR